MRETYFIFCFSRKVYKKLIPPHHILLCKVKGGTFGTKVVYMLFHSVSLDLQTTFIESLFTFALSCRQKQVGLKSYRHSLFLVPFFASFHYQNHLDFGLKFHPNMDAITGGSEPASCQID
ncbi:hypothetical protein AAZV13_02G236900 [Glycine max]